MRIEVSSHAQRKFKILERYGFHLDKITISNILQHPDKRQKGRNICQGAISEKHLLRIVYEEGEEDMKIDYSKDVDIATIEFEIEGTIDHGEEVENMVIHITKDNRPIFIEVLEAKAFLKEFSEAVREKEAIEAK